MYRISEFEDLVFIRKIQLEYKKQTILDIQGSQIVAEKPLSELLKGIGKKYNIMGWAQY